MISIIQKHLIQNKSNLILVQIKYWNNLQHYLIKLIALPQIYKLAEEPLLLFVAILAELIMDSRHIPMVPKEKEMTRLYFQKLGRILAIQK